MGADSISEEFGRLDSALIVGSTAALISTLVVSPDLVEPNETPTDATPTAASAPSASVPKKKEEAPSDPRAERLNKAIAHIRKQRANQPGTEEKLRKVLITHFKNKLEEAQLIGLLDDLKAKGVIVLENKKLTYRLK